MTETSPTTDPSAASPSGALHPRLDPDKVAALVARVRQEVDAGLSPATQIAVALDGEVVVEAAFGAPPDARICGFSSTKALVAGAMWRLIDAGEVDIARPVADYIPEFATNGKEVVTVDQVLTHTGGFPWAPMGPDRWGTSAGRREAFARWRLTLDPGTAYVYHPVAGHWVLGELIATATSMDHADAIEELVTAPLGLPRLLGIPVDQQAGTIDSVGYGETPTPEEMEEAFGFKVDISQFIAPDVALGALLTLNDPEARAVGVPGGGGLYRARDLALLYQGFLRNPGDLWSADILRLGTEHVRMNLPDIWGVPASRALGLVIAGDDGFADRRGFGRTASPRSFGHNGAGGQLAFADPDSGLSVGYLTAGLDQHMIRQGKRDIAIASLAADLLAS